MKKLSSVTHIINIMILTLVVMLTSGATATTDATKSTPQPVKPQPQDTVTIQSNKVTHVSLPSSIANLVDPTQPPDAVISPNKSFSAIGPMSLTAIFYYPDNQAAIIDGDFVRPGDSVGEYTIINIHRDTVELIGVEGKELTLRMFPQIKQYRDKERQ